MKKDQNRQIYYKILKNMTPEQKLLKSFELSEYSKQLCLAGLRQKYPDLSETEIKKIYLKIVEKCHNNNY
ncbi:MAG: hypothetical protein A2086_06295 [Spirochaetes bacterium GWD1_27_9]|nr:MAG: hypothetical protein A2Z98_05400 [Spirochaetes bacterium GWB1_27_13]OHD30875.1 MAG: hypothetical protein A2086_06295 [Spirochaetes bacterium GWD1_27_9]